MYSWSAWSGKDNHDAAVYENSNSELTEKEQEFCIFYVQSWNATQSYIKAFGSKYNTAMVEGCKILRNPKIKKEIEELYDDIPLFDEDELKKWIDDFQFEISSL